MTAGAVVLFLLGALLGCTVGIVTMSLMAMSGAAPPDDRLPARLPARLLNDPPTQEANPMRFRHLFFAAGSLIVLAGLFLTDPDRGVSTGMLLLALVTPVLAVVFAHFARKALHDYDAADAHRLFNIAGGSPVGAGLALIAIAIVTSALLGLFGNVARAGEIPAAAEAHRQTLRTELASHWPAHPLPAAVPALIEHESCITLRHPRCWSATSRLKTQREEGAGLGQLTRAYRPDGSLRFDALAEMRGRHPALRELSWSNVYQRPDLQLRALVLMGRDNYRALDAITSPVERLAFADAAYNGGLGGVRADRRACQVTAGCDPQRWWGHVERTCTKSRAALYGQRSACDINRFHVRDVLTVRAPKYAGWLS